MRTLTVLVLALIAIAWGEAARATRADDAHSSLAETILSCAALLGGPTAKRNFLIRQGVIAHLPQSLSMGYVVNHRVGYGAETVFSSIPLPGRTAHAHLVDLAKWGYDTPIPKRFVIGDGKNHRALIGVDLRPGSPLSRQVARIRKIIQWTLGDDKTGLLELIAHNNANQLGPVIRTAQERSAPTPALPWDGLPADAPIPKDDFKQLPLNHPPLAARFSLRVVALEDLIQRGESYCLGQALLAWILLREYGIASRLLLGANATADHRYIGHTSVALPDGRIVDPAGWLVIPPPSPHDRNLFGFGAGPSLRFVSGFSSYAEGSTVPQPTWRFAYDRYPIVVLED